MRFCCRLRTAAAAAAAAANAAAAAACQQLLQQRRCGAPGRGCWPTAGALALPGGGAAGAVQAQLGEPGAGRQGVRAGRPGKGVPRQLLRKADVMPVESVQTSRAVEVKKACAADALKPQEHAPGGAPPAPPCARTPRRGPGGARVRRGASPRSRTWLSSRGRPGSRARRRPGTRGLRCREESRQGMGRRQRCRRQQRRRRRRQRW